MSNYSRIHEAQLRAKTDAELQQAIDDYTRRGQEHTENDRPLLAAAAASKVERARRIQAERETPAPITASVRGLPVYVDKITDGDGITRTLSRPIRLL